MKKAIALILTLAMSLSLAACSGGGSGSGAASNPPAASGGSSTSGTVSSSSASGAYANLEPVELSLADAAAVGAAGETFDRLFAEKVEEEDREFWRQAAAASREYLHKACHPQTGLSAEYADYDGTPHAGHQEIFGKHDWYYSDAYRTIANIAMDHLWYDKDPWQTEIANRLQRFYCEEQRLSLIHI